MRRMSRAGILVDLDRWMERRAAMLGARPKILEAMYPGLAEDTQPRHQAPSATLVYC